MSKALRGLLLTLLFSPLVFGESEFPIRWTYQPNSKLVKVGFNHLSTTVGIHGEMFTSTLYNIHPLISEIFFNYTFEHLTFDGDTEDSFDFQGHAFQLGLEINYKKYFGNRLAYGLSLENAGDGTDFKNTFSLMQIFDFRKLYFEFELFSNDFSDKAIYQFNLHGLAGVNLTHFLQLRFHAWYFPTYGGFSYSGEDFIVGGGMVWVLGRAFEVLSLFRYNFKNLFEIKVDAKYEPPVSFLPSIILGVKFDFIQSYQIRAGIEYPILLGKKNEDEIISKQFKHSLIKPRDNHLLLPPLYNGTEESQYDYLSETVPSILASAVTEGTGKIKITENKEVNNVVHFYKSTDKTDVEPVIRKVLKGKYDVRWVVTSRLTKKNKKYTLQIHINDLTLNTIKSISKKSSKPSRSRLQKLVDKLANELLKELLK